MMNILFLSAHKYMPELTGGMEINTHDMAKLLINKGHNVSIFAGFRGEGFLGIKAKINKIVTKRNWIRSSYGGYTVYRSFDVTANISQIIDFEQPNVVILQGGASYYTLLNKLAEDHNELPVISYFHTPDPLPISDAQKLPNHLKYIVNSNYTKRLHSDKPIELVLPPIFFKEKYKVERNNKRFATFINPSRHKGLDIALSIAKSHPSIKFKFVVNNRLKITALTQSELLSNNIEIVGPFEDMREIYSQTRVLLAPSQWVETWGRIASEAHFSGIPVLSSCQGGLPEAVGPGGISLPYNAKLEDWQSAFNTLWEDKDGMYSKAALMYSQRDEMDPSWNINALLQLTSLFND